MPKVIIEFDLPAEKEEHAVYSQALGMHSALWCFSQDILRQLDKYGQFEGREMTDEEAHIVSHIREEFHKILNEYGVEL